MTELLSQAQALRDDQATDEATRLAEAQAYYVALLHRADHPEPGDAESLAAVLSDLGLTEEAVKTHLRVIEKYRKLRARHEQLDEARAEDRRRREEKRQLEVRHREEARTAHLASCAASTKLSQCGLALQEAQKLARTTPMLLEVVPGEVFPRLRGV